MVRYYLAVDIGASSGRHILGHISDGKMELEEVYRFSNGMIEKNGHHCWDVEQLFREIVNGLKECKRIGKIPYSMAIDTWAVDYVLLDHNDQVLGNTAAYRDGRTEGMDEEVYKIISEANLYEKTGIQKQIFNTIYQLMSVKKNEPKLLEQAETMLMIPEYFNDKLTGVKMSEYTNGTTTQLLDPVTKKWNKELIAQLGYPAKMFGELHMPGTFVGELTEELAAEVGFQCKVILAATHDTASAVMAVPSIEEDTLYISSGTWSLMGTELKEADCSKESRELNFTNEGGYDYRFRYLKNIMGLWMIQSVRKELAPDMGFGEICEMASKEKINSLVDCNAARFLAPKNMAEEVQAACREAGSQVPEGISEIACVIYNSLAKCYADTAAQVEQMTGKHYRSIYIVGGGANADYLNKLTAKATERTIYAGPTEATAVGNLMAQMISDQALENLTEARKCVMRSFDIKKYQNT